MNLDDLRRKYEAHEAEAELILYEWEACDNPSAALAAAQVHATLAQALATLMAGAELSLSLQSGFSE